MAKDSLLGKDIAVTFLRAGGAPFKIESTAFSETAVFKERTKHPLGEASEYRRNDITGWTISMSGELVDSLADDILNEIEQASRNRQPLPALEIRTREIYADGTVKNWKFSSDTGITVTSAEKSGGNGSDARTYSLGFYAQRRDPA